jgi:hypothetical protein
VEEVIEVTVEEVVTVIVTITKTIVKSEEAWVVAQDQVLLMLTAKNQSLKARMMINNMLLHHAYKRKILNR